MRNIENKKHDLHALDSRTTNRNIHKTLHNHFSWKFYQWWVVLLIHVTPRSIPNNNINTASKKAPSNNNNVKVWLTSKHNILLLCSLENLCNVIFLWVSFRWLSTCLLGSFRCNLAYCLEHWHITFLWMVPKKKNKSDEMISGTEQTWSVDDPRSSCPDRWENCEDLWIIVSVSFRFFTISPTLGLLCRSTSTQLKATWTHLFTCLEYDSKKCTGIFACSLSIQFLCTYQFRT